MQHKWLIFLPIIATMLSKLLSKRIREYGLTMQDFCETHLKTDYRTFQHRMRTERYYPSEVIYICMLLGDRCENIFGKSFEDLVILQGTEHVATATNELISNDPGLYSRIINPPLQIRGSGPTTQPPLPERKPLAKSASVKKEKSAGPKELPIVDKPEKDTPKNKTEEAEFKFEFLDVNLLNSPVDDSRRNH